MNKTLKKFLPKIIGFRLNSLFLVKPGPAVLQAFYLFCTPRRGRAEPEQIGFLNPAKIEKITVEGISLQIYQWKGAQETILLIHGWESNAHRWKQLIEKLQHKKYNIIVFDAPAHGNSSGKLFNVPLYAKCVDALVQKFSPSYIIGHSVGGMTAMYHQFKHSPKNSLSDGKACSKIVLLGAPSELEPIMRDFQKILNLSPRFMKALEVYFHQKFGFWISEFSTASFAKNLSQKGLIVHDKYDKIVPVSDSKAIHKNWKGSQLFITEGAGHSLDNEEIHAAIIGFLEKSGSQCL